MKLTEKEAALEAILFTMGEAVETKRLAEAIGETPEKTRELLEKLRAGWEKEHRGVNLISLEDSWQMCTRSEFYDYLIRIAKAPKKYTLTDTLLETLSIIAYKQPVTRLDVESGCRTGKPQLSGKQAAKRALPGVRAGWKSRWKERDRTES